MDKHEIAEKLRASDVWDMELAEELCALAGMLEEFKNADGDEFEQVIFAAADVLDVEII